jgi:hypothetical protein
MYPGQLFISRVIISPIMDLFSHLTLKITDCDCIEGMEANYIYAFRCPMPWKAMKKQS